MAAVACLFSVRLSYSRCSLQVTTVQDKRQELFVLFRNLCKLCPNEAISFVRQQLQAVLNGQQMPMWQVGKAL